MIVESRMAGCAQQHRLRVQTGFERAVRQWVIEFIDGDAADLFSRERELVIEFPGDSFKHAHGFSDDFGADAVAGKNCNLDLHISASPIMQKNSPAGASCL